eukprot:TRINITY_DN3755_c0_g1_i1.p2 TRINITY_DN3755_c0_g1~~TRINITY_DN3755_c0_g1_i1.p2  ORF type:complete len:167 (-),score=29.01 TRINITY_DN3755_c0_g1_i1:66-566(-)
MSSKNDTEIQEKNKEIFKLRMQIHQILDITQMDSARHYLNDESKALKDSIEGRENEKKELTEELNRLQSIQEEQHQLQQKLEALSAASEHLSNELSPVYNDIMNLSKVVKEMLKGKEPSIQSLWGLYKQETCADFNLKELRKTVDSLCGDVCDYYAERYSNECAVQ